MRFLIVLLLAGCAMSPAELRRTSPVIAFDSALPPLQAAQCLGRAAEAYPKLIAGDQFAATWRQGPARDGYEVLVRRTASVPLLVVDVVPRDTGSSVKIWQSSVLDMVGDGDLGAEMAKGCR